MNNLPIYISNRSSTVKRTCGVGRERLRSWEDACGSHKAFVWIFYKKDKGGYRHWQVCVKIPVYPKPIRKWTFYSLKKALIVAERITESGLERWQKDLPPIVETVAVFDATVAVAANEPDGLRDSWELVDPWVTCVSDTTLKGKNGNDAKTRFENRKAAFLRRMQDKADKI